MKNILLLIRLGYDKKKKKKEEVKQHYFLSIFNFFHFNF